MVRNLSDLLELDVQASKQGCYDQSHVVRLKAGENRRDFALTPLPTDNLLHNGDFEQGFPAARSIEHGTQGERGAWRFSYSPGIACYIYPESIYQWRRPHMLRGQEAISHVTDGGGTLELSQDVTVDAGQSFEASAWILGLDVQGNGSGFGASGQDFAGIVIQELDSQGQVLVSHPRVGVEKASENFELVRTTFTTEANTVQVRLTLTSHLECSWQQGAAIFDDCVLKAIPQPTDTPAP